MGLMSWLVAAGTRHDQSDRDRLADRHGDRLRPPAPRRSSGASRCWPASSPGRASTLADFGHFLLWTTLGNAVGGPFFVALIKYGHASAEANQVPQPQLSEMPTLKLVPWRERSGSHGARPTASLRAQDAEGAGRQGGPRPLDHGRAELRRRLGLHHRRHAAQHRRHRHGRHSRPAQGPPAQPGAGLRERRRVHEVLVRGRRGPARRPFVLVIEGSIPNEKIKSEGYWAALGTDKTHRPADHHLRMDRPPGAQGVGRRRRRHLRHLRRHPRHGRQPDRLHGPGRLPRLELALQGRPARSSTCPAARCSRTTSWKRSSICSTRWPASPR